MVDLKHKSTASDTGTRAEGLLSFPYSTLVAVFTVNSLFASV